ncbi:MAG: hypothetical protein JSR85_03950 [Proteobacteria bacterium]|nr:hypothetical protein [Pseudomonadota bacterium]
MLFLFLEAFFSSNFRTTQDKIWSTQHVDLTGLRELKASGGTSVRFPDLRRRLSHVQDPIVIIDGINEFHGYVQGIPSTFFAYQHSNPHWKYYIRRIVFTGTTDVRPDLVIPESQMAQQNGFTYYHVKIGSKFISSKETIDEIVKIFDELPSNAWIHFHCHYGKGRTSMMLVMYDIMKNAPHISLENIVKRQHLLGSEDLLNTVVWKKGSYTKQQLEERANFIKAFYDFVCQRKAGGIQKWSAWKNNLP